MVLYSCYIHTVEQRSTVAINDRKKSKYVGEKWNNLTEILSPDKQPHLNGLHILVLSEFSKDEID